MISCAAAAADDDDASGHRASRRRMVMMVSSGGVPAPVWQQRRRLIPWMWLRRLLIVSSLFGNSLRHSNNNNPTVSSGGFMVALAWMTPPPTKTLSSRRRRRSLSSSFVVLLSQKSSQQSSRPRQVLRFLEPTTGVPVTLVGSVHYNPVSVHRARSVVQELVVPVQQDTDDEQTRNNRHLGAVIIESCPARWNSSTNTTTTPLWMQKLLYSEMRAAYDVAVAAGRPVLLGDQDIAVTGTQLKGGITSALTDLATGSWQRYSQRLSDARALALPTGPGYLGLADLFDPILLLAFPVALVKYPLSYVVKAPVTSMVVLTGVWVLNSYGAAGASSSMDVAAAATTTDSILLTHSSHVDQQLLSSWLDVGLNLFFSTLETLVFARIFLVELLVERNEIIAQNILEECRRQRQKQQPWWKQPQQPWSMGKIKDNNDIPYAPGSVAVGNVSGASSSKGNQSGDGGVEVVAVLGMAHCNGVMKLLQEQRLQ